MIFHCFTKTLFRAIQQSSFEIADIKFWISDIYFRLRNHILRHCWIYNINLDNVKIFRKINGIKLDLNDFKSLTDLNYFNGSNFGPWRDYLHTR